MGESFLQGTDIVMAQCDVVLEIARSFQPVWVDAINSGTNSASDRLISFKQVMR